MVALDDRPGARRREAGRGGGDAGRPARPAARPAGRHQGPGGDEGAAHHLGQPALRRPHPDARRGDGGQPARGGRHRDGQDQHAGIRRRREHPQHRLRRDRQPLRPTKSAAGSSGGSAVALATGAWCRSAPAATPAARCATPRPSTASSASGPRRGWCRPNGAAHGWSALPVLGPMARNARGLRADALRHGGRRCGWTRWPTRCHGRPVRGGRPRPVPADARWTWARLRVAATPDFGFAPTERHIRDVFAEPRRSADPAVRPGGGGDARIAPAPTRPSRCCAPPASCSPR